MDSLESVQHFVDDYLGYLYELRPTAASFDGVHAFDDHVEDFTRAALDRQTRELGGFARRLASIRPDALSLDDRLDRAMLEQDVHARLLELERVRPHERSPQFYADTLSTTLASQVVLDYAPAHERGRRLVSKLRQVPPFLNAARQNVKDPPGLFVKTAIETLRGLVAFIERDMPRALWDLDDLFVLGDLADASTEAVRAIDAYATELETDALPKATRLVPARARGVRREAAARRGHRRPARQADRHRRARAERDAGSVPPHRQPHQGRRSARDVAGAEGRPSGRGQGGRRGARAGRRRCGRSSSARGSSRCPSTTRFTSAPTPPFCRWTFASIWCPGPFEAQAASAPTTT